MYEGDQKPIDKVKETKELRKILDKMRSRLVDKYDLPEDQSMAQGEPRHNKLWDDQTFLRWEDNFDYQYNRLIDEFPKDREINRIKRAHSYMWSRIPEQVLYFGCEDAQGHEENIDESVFEDEFNPPADKEPTEEDLASLEEEIKKDKRA